jgi:ribosome-associated protein
MEKDTFKLRPTDEFIELINLLKLKQIAQSGGHAKMIVEDGLVKVNGEQEFRKRKKLRPGDIVELEEITISIIK